MGISRWFTARRQQGTSASNYTQPGHPVGSAVSLSWSRRNSLMARFFIGSFQASSCNSVLHRTLMFIPNGRTTISRTKKQVGFEHGTVSFAGDGEDSRSCHIFIAFEPNGLQLGHAPHETPIGKVTKAGLPALERMQEDYKAAGYGDLTFLQQDLITQGFQAAAD